MKPEEVTWDMVKDINLKKALDSYNKKNKSSYIGWSNIIMYHDDIKDENTTLKDLISEEDYNKWVNNKDGKGTEKQFYAGLLDAVIHEATGIDRGEIRLKKYQEEQKERLRKHEEEKKKREEEKFLSLTPEQIIKKINANQRKAQKLEKENDRYRKRLLELKEVK